MLPKWQTVYYYYRKWRADGTLVLLHDQLRTQLRTQLGREPEPQIAIIDSQSVKTTEKGGEHGYDAGKKINGRKRHIAVDSQGLLLSIVVHSANLVDRLGAPLLLWRMGLQRKWPRLELVYADGGYSGPIVSAASEQLGCKLEISSPPPGTKGFAPVSQRWKVERMFGWLGRSRKLSKEYDVLTDCSEGWVYWAMTRLMLRRLVAT